VNISDFLKAELKRLGHDLQASGHELQLFAAQQAAQLVLLAGLPGYDRALTASAEMIAMKAGLLAIGLAEAEQERIRAILLGFLLGATRVPV
jgi:hypothetical protein